jgi:branched-chain amino acid transport system permease protein
MFMVQTLAYNLRSLTHGSQGMALPTAPFAVATFERPYYYAMAILLAFTVGACWAVRSSKLGLALNAVRDDEDRARGLGVQTELVKMVAFAVSAGLTAGFGAVWAYYITYIYPGFAIDPLLSLGAILMAFLGGRRTLWGPVVGAALVVPAQQYFAPLPHRLRRALPPRHLPPSRRHHPIALPPPQPPSIGLPLAHVA